MTDERVQLPESILADVVHKFERAWQRGEQPQLEEYVQVGDTTLLVELIHVDMERRIKSGKSAVVEEYCARFVELQGSPELVVDLIVAECDLRRRTDKDLGLKEYVGRFPQFQIEIEKRLAEETIVTSSESLQTPCDVPITLSPEKHPLPSHIDRYHVERILGKGGFGLVYLARDEQLDRQVALKVPHANLVRTEEDAKVYLCEARMVASLDHPNIVPVYDVGQTDGAPVFIVSKYIDGQSLSQRKQQERLSWVEAAEIVVQLAEALHYAHKSRLVHRDIKPGNILLDESGTPYLVDFGLAIRDTEASKSTRYAGTPAYMSPEQARGEGHRVDGRSDIYSLGTVLYELVTGYRPFVAESVAELFELITSVEPRPPRQLDEALPKELERICLRALSKRLTDRYSNAADFADDLSHLLASEHGKSKCDPKSSIGTPQTSLEPGFRANQTPSQTPNRATGATPILDFDSQPLRIVPKGLRSFDEHDADFFLELLPGPRDRDGLPESIRFWKQRIEESDSDKTFQVGLIYGPSGCGKSSLVKAGLLPRLSKSIRTIYLEASPDDTEDRLLHELRTAIPGLSQRGSLRETVAALRREPELLNGRKLLIVVDQFEQWLHGCDEAGRNELVTAIRQCDGGSVQSIVMVRDDYWLSASRFAQSIDDRFHDGVNSTLVDLFGEAHADRVLTAFGRAYGRLTESLGQPQREFITRAVQELAEDGKVIPVRLSLFADMLKEKEWSTETLSHLGGIQGVGVRFLEETFSARVAPAEHRLHETAAREVLKALLPKLGQEIRGNWCSRSELQTSSGYESKDFVDLIRILDTELRLITPVESLQPSKELDDEFTKHFQLTHDYLVPSLREWLTRKKRETWRGRAEIRLDVCTSLWERSREPRFLPGVLDYLHIQFGVPLRRRSNVQSELLRVASFRYGTWSLSISLILMIAGWLAYDFQVRSRAQLVSQSILIAQPSELGPLIDEELPTVAGRISPFLNAAVENEVTSPGARLRAHLALNAIDGKHAEYLGLRLFDCALGDFVVLRDRLAPGTPELNSMLWSRISSADINDEDKVRAAMALALYDPGSANWNKELTKRLTSRLVDANQDQRTVIQQLLRPIAAQLHAPLLAVFRDRNQSNRNRESAALILLDYFPTDSQTLANIISESNAGLYRTTYGLVEDGGAKLHQELAVDLSAVVSKTAWATSSEEARVRLGRRRSGAAVTLVRMGQIEYAMPVFNDVADPEALTQFVHGCRSRGIVPADILETLNQAKSEHELYGTLLALGEFQPNEFEEMELNSLIERITELHRLHPRSSVHGASGWLLRQWGFTGVTEEVDHTAIPYDPTGQRDWFVLEVIPRKQQSSDTHESLFFTFVVFAEHTFSMGSPAWEESRQTSESQRTVSLSRMAILDREVNWVQYRAFVGDALFDRNRKHGQGMINESCAAAGMPWSETVDFCRWLDQEVGLSSSESCYEAIQTNSNENETTWKLTLDRKGFRLPTEAEWETACRAGTTTTFGFGSDRSLCSHYAWSKENARVTRPVGLLRPNLRGLFDFHGNVIEWCHDWHSYDHTTTDNPTGPATSVDSRKVLRGGGWAWHTSEGRSAKQSMDHPKVSAPIYGFRIVMRPE